MQVAKPRSAKVFEMQLLPASERTCPWKFATIQSPFFQLFTLPQVSGFHQGLFANHSSFVGGSLWFLRGRCHWLIWLSCLWLYQKLSTLFGIQITSTMRQPSWSCPSVLSDTGSMSLGRFLPRATLSYAWFWILRTEKLRKQVVWPRTLTAWFSHERQPYMTRYGACAVELWGILIVECHQKLQMLPRSRCLQSFVAEQMCQKALTEVAKPTSNLHVMDHVGAVCKRGGREAATSATNRCRPGRQRHFATRWRGGKEREGEVARIYLRQLNYKKPSHDFFFKSCFCFHLLSATSFSPKDVLAQELGILRPGGPSADPRGAKGHEVLVTFQSFQGRT